MKVSLLTLCALFAITLLDGCKSDHRSVTRELVIGTYVYKSDGPSRESLSQFLSCPIGVRLILHENGKYELITAEPTKPGSLITGRWVFRDGDPASVDLDHSDYPIEIHGDIIRLVIDNDVGARYEKLR
jgi:hypothetical protein